MSKYEIVKVNYWKELGKEINSTIGSMRGLVLLTHNSAEFSDIVNFLNLIKKDEKLTLLYISLVHSYDHMKQVLKEKPLISKKLYVVDCVSGFVIEIQDHIDCVYRKPPQNLEAMKDIIIKNIQSVNPNIIVVDTLSQFINFSAPQDVELHNFYKFLREIKSDAMGIVNDTVILLYDDKLGSMVKLPTLFTNHILRLEVIREMIDWKD